MNSIKCFIVDSCCNNYLNNHCQHTHSRSTVCLCVSAIFSKHDTMYAIPLGVSETMCECMEKQTKKSLSTIAIIIIKKDTRIWSSNFKKNALNLRGNGCHTNVSRYNLFHVLSVAFTFPLSFVLAFGFGFDFILSLPCSHSVCI